MARKNKQSQPPEDETEIQKVSRLVAASSSGDREADAELRHIYETDKAWSKILADSALHLEHQWADLLSGGSPAISKVISNRLVSMREDLAGKEATPLERLVASDIILSWVQHLHATKQSLHLLQQSEHTYKSGEYRLKRQDSAHRRLEGSVKLMALLRRVRPPLVQVNLGQQQIINPPNFGDTLPGAAEPIDSTALLSEGQGTPLDDMMLQPQETPVPISR